MNKENPVNGTTAAGGKRDFEWRVMYKGRTLEDIRRGFLNNLEYTIAKDRYGMTPYDEFLGLVAFTVRDRLIER